MKKHYNKLAVITYASLSMLGIISGQHQMVAENWFRTIPDYDVASSTCVQDSECASYDTPEIGTDTHVCALVEMYQVAAIQIQNYVKQFRSKHCIQRSECNIQTTHKD